MNLLNICLLTNAIQKIKSLPTRIYCAEKSMSGERP